MRIYKATDNGFEMMTYNGLASRIADDAEYNPVHEYKAARAYTYRKYGVKLRPGLGGGTQVLESDTTTISANTKITRENRPDITTGPSPEWLAEHGGAIPPAMQDAINAWKAAHEGEHIFRSAGTKTIYPDGHETTVEISEQQVMEWCKGLFPYRSAVIDLCYFTCGNVLFADPVDVLVPFDTNLTMSDEQSTSKIEILCSDPDPLPCGTFLRTVEYSVDKDGAKSWEPTETDGKKNYTNWVVVSTSVKFYDHFDYMGIRYRHNYELKEVLQTLKDYPVRSSKTFAEGEYTYREVLEIVLGLFFKPRTLSAAFKIADCPALDEKNARLSYTQATVYDVVADIGRIIDMTPNMEVEWDADNKRYLFTLEYLNSYGGEGDAVDIDYFDWRDVQTSESSRDRHAGSVISNVQNLVASEGMAYPGENVGLYPGATNQETDADRQKAIFRLPSAIKRLKEVRIWYRRDAVNRYKSFVGDDISKTVEWGDVVGFRKELGNNTVLTFGTDLYKYTPLVITENGATVDGKPVFYKNPTGSRFEPNSDADVFIASPEEYKYLYDVYPKGDQTIKTKKNVITYVQGAEEIDLSPIFSVYYYMYGATDWGGESTEVVSEWIYGGFGTSDTKTIEDYSANGSTTADNPKPIFRPIVAVVYEPYLSGVIRGESGVASDTTVFFNQYGQIVDSKAFGNAIENYADEMSGGTRIVGKIAQPVGGKTFRALYRELPTVGCTVKDGDRRYVLTQLSITRRQQSLDLLAELSERKKVRSRVVQADSSQTIYAIPDSDIQESKTHAHYILRISDKPIADERDDSAAIVTDNVRSMILSAFGVYSSEGFVYGSPVFAKVNATDSGNGTHGPYIVVPSRTYTSKSMFYFINFPDNRNMGGRDDDGYPYLYTDTRGKVEKMRVGLYQTTDTQTSLQHFPLYTQATGDFEFLAADMPLRKDSYEQTSVTFQLTAHGEGNVVVTDSFWEATPFRDGDHDGTGLLFFSEPITDWRNPPTPTRTIYRSAWSASVGKDTLTIASASIPAHGKAWAFGRVFGNGTDSSPYEIEEIYMYANASVAEAGKIVLNLAEGFFQL